MTGSHGSYSMGDSTRCVRAIEGTATAGEPMLRGPVFAAPYHLGPEDEPQRDTYARGSHPGWRDLERALALLEGASGTRVVGSGMSAIAVVLRSLLHAGDTLVVPTDGYFQVRTLAADLAARSGIDVHEVPTTAFNSDALERIFESARGRVIVLVESPSNPALDVIDIRRLAARCGAAGAKLIVDNTTATPLGQQPLALGAHAVVASGTKSLSGHSDLLMGYVAASDDELLDAVERERLQAGTVLGPFETWLALRSLGSAGLRIERQCANAAAVAAMLVNRPQVRNVRYPGLVDDPAHEIARLQMRRYGSLVGLELGSADEVHRFIAGSELLVSATSFGGLHTTADRRARWGDQVPEGFVRLSCGIEDTDDILADIDQALGSL
ncbi:MAG: cystathionine gamma-lyase [Rhodococcus sp.]|nr:cystathionine gamma-lyase [Rhodococcus sp. (in: high G+C Gram-positive bacteria)]